MKSLWILLLCSFSFISFGQENDPLIDEDDIAEKEYDSMFYHPYEIPAQPVCGLESFFNSLQQRVEEIKPDNFPENKKGKVHICFTVTESGKIEDPYVIKGLNADADSLAINAFRLMKTDFIPAIIVNKKIKSKLCYTVRIN
ncbi:hypothetical protein KMW28_27580 [Flammeovirga yaeyamensis]|uniref:TonB C-terminal domain-containing protein n=1 Tax=Flammeovirga yaeyamensis TaxID=367791 RepID=A0AAX1NAS9_9BACT|nr:hypothetical protein [Flammeovirga yaeyamensis]MBB3699954.1 hypothetical protein [Flammeovirga yaeyamensis]NMF37607.1 hypothetical protein [Flammeovirga yaeyamensis]QWG04663.1 hypothetical protein KMW28_27580 [Flammeovirga yaeyamensis]